MKYSATFDTFRKDIGVSEDVALELIAASEDLITFCKKVSEQYGYELTLSQASEIYETASI
jgi:hypothetical protein